MYKVISNKQTIVIRTNEVNELNLDFDFDDFSEALDFYESYIADHAKHVGTICATRIVHVIQLIDIFRDKTTIHYKLTLSN